MQFLCDRGANRAANHYALGVKFTHFDSHYAWVVQNYANWRIQWLFNSSFCIHFHYDSVTPLDTRQTHARPARHSLASHAACHTIADIVHRWWQGWRGRQRLRRSTVATQAGGGSGRWIDLTAIVQPLPAAANAPHRASAASSPSSPCYCWGCCCCRAG